MFLHTQAAGNAHRPRRVRNVFGLLFPLLLCPQPSFNNQLVLGISTNNTTTFGRRQIECFFLFLFVLQLISLRNRSPHIDFTFVFYVMFRFLCVGHWSTGDVDWCVDDVRIVIEEDDDRRRKKILCFLFWRLWRPRNDENIFHSFEFEMQSFLKFCLSVLVFMFCSFMLCKHEMFCVLHIAHSAPLPNDNATLSHIRTMNWINIAIKLNKSRFVVFCE